MANFLSFTRGLYVAPIEARAAVEAVEWVPATAESDEIPAVEAVEAVEARPGGWHLANHALVHNGNNWSGSLWLEGPPEDATDDDIAAAIMKLYGIKG